MDNELIMVLAKILGEQQANKTLSSYDARNVMHQRWNGKRGAMTRIPSNVESAPAMYLNDKLTATGVSKDDWYKGSHAAARATTSGLGGIKYPADYGIELSDLVHEMEHTRQFGGRTPIQKRQVSDVETYKEMLEAMEKYKKSDRELTDPYRSLSGQTDQDEIMPQLKAYEAMLQSGNTLTRSPLGRMFSPAAKALFERYKYEQPDLDAMVR